ncbi:hypothetical protein COC42_00495 [Sphingomonas spermidinifaciens]|uniref:Uncharacterized protein n=1 Tax=Sphingomonas spermidinifaciens TaxID=1141889 RepID=A0A2A4B5N1_9SPHN|nr:hypothetical protein [Sphingomonas spermidinifaciens]PCD02954.1 hypothetical protein COC42_00495 [Sphingomonas spermidinifaciens]
MHNRVFAVVITAAFVLAPGASALSRADREPPCAIPFDPAMPLRARVGEPSRDVLAAYRGSGATGVGPHNLSDAEWKQVDAAIAALPRQHRDILQRHLRRISFVEASDGAGNALTSQVDADCGEALFDLTLRAGLFRESLSRFLTDKEAGLFEADGSGTTVRIEAGELPAVPYILLHESSHIVDRVLGLSTRNAFREGVWARGEGRALAPGLVNNATGSIAWRGGAKRPIGDAAALYAGMRQTPFVSLYASVAPGEELAELIAWQQLEARWHVRPAIVVRDLEGKILHRYVPLDAPAVRARLKRVTVLLASGS